MSKNTKGTETDSKGYTSEDIGELIASVPTTVEPKPKSRVVEDERLAELERQVKDGERSFIATGKALKAIRDMKLWEGRGHDKFSDYCRAAFDMDETYATRLIQGADTVRRMDACGVYLMNEGQARAVRKIMDAPFAPADASIGVILNASVILTGKQTAKGIEDTFADMQDLGVAVGRKKAPALAEALRRARDARAEAAAKAKENAKAERAKREAEAEALRAKNAEEAAAKPAPKPVTAPEPTEAPTGWEPVVHDGGASTEEETFVDSMFGALGRLAGSSGREWAVFVTHIAESPDRADYVKDMQDVRNALTGALMTLGGESASA